MSNDYYAVLGVARDAEPEVVTASYRALAKKYHPDVNKAPDAVSKLARLNEAYAILNDPERRRAYDDTLGARPSASYKGRQTEIAADETSTLAKDDLHEPAAARAANNPQDKSLIGDFVYLVIGVPVIWLLSMFLADVIFKAIVIIPGEWLTTDGYTASKAITRLIDLVTKSWHQLTREAPPPQSEHISIFSTAFGVAWLFGCSAVATGAVASHARDERPRLPVWLIAAVVVALFGFVAFNDIRGITAAATESYRINLYATVAAVFGGVVYGVRTEIRERRALLAPRA